MDDRRIVRRTRVLRNAKIILDHRASLIHCTVLDLTSSGARLSLAATDRVPETFELTFEHGRSRRLCHVRWRTDNKIGVSFGKPVHCTSTSD
jgi:hypothetical protein